MIETGSYLIHLREMEKGQIRYSQVIGTNLDHSPEFSDSQSNQSLIERLAEIGEGKVLKRDFTEDNPFERDRKETFQPVDLWEWMLKFAVLIFPIDVGIRRIQIDSKEWKRFITSLKRILIFSRESVKDLKHEDSLNSLLAKRDEAREKFINKHDIEPTATDSEIFQPRNINKGNSLKKISTENILTKTKNTDDKKESQEDSTTSRLLAAKKNALRNKK